jgi:flagellar biosynthesis anti-sigma factor FlgM
MTMKIDGNRLTPDLDATRRAEQTRQTEKTANERTAAAKADRVEVSKDAQLVAAALKAANEAPAVRQDVVDKMRKLMESGELGKDSAKLADKLIDHLLNK